MDEQSVNMSTVIHNGYMELLVATGILGFGTMLLFFVLIVVRFYKHFKHFSRIKIDKLAPYFCIFLIPAIGNLAFNFVFMQNTFFAALFWLTLGAIYSQISDTVSTQRSVPYKLICFFKKICLSQSELKKD